MSQSDSPINHVAIFPLASIIAGHSGVSNLRISKSFATSISLSRTAPLEISKSCYEISFTNREIEAQMDK